MQPMCFPNPGCASDKYININSNKQTECVDDCGVNIARRFDNGTIMCVGSCPVGKTQMQLDDSTYKCIDSCSKEEINKYDPDTNTFSCVVSAQCETSAFERFEMDSGDLICIKKCSDSLIHVDVGTDIPICRAKCSGQQPYLNVNLITKVQSCVAICPDGKIHADYGDQIIKCVENCPPSKFQFRKDDSSSVCIKPCLQNQIPIDMRNGNLFPTCKSNNCTSSTSPYIDLTSTSSWSCISQQTCIARQEGNRYPIHIEQFEQWSYDKCIDQDLSLAYDQGSSYYYMDGFSSSPNKNCSFDHPCKIFEDNNYAFSKMNETVGHLIFLRNSFVLNVTARINTTSSQQRLFISYPIGGEIQQYINATKTGMFYLTRGWAVFKSIMFRVNDNFPSQNYLIILEFENSKLDLVNCAFGGIYSNEIDRGLLTCMTKATLNIEALTVNQIKMLQYPVISLDNTAGLININNSRFQGVNRTRGSGAAIQCNLVSQSGGLTIGANTTFTNCVSKYSFEWESQSMQYDIGAIYVKIPEGAYHRFDLRGAIYMTSSVTWIGKGLFIETGNLTEAMRRSDLGTKYGTITPSVANQEMYMMGIDETQRWLTTPLQYTVQNVTNGIYHINNPNTGYYWYNDASGKTSGNDNEFCGFVRFPCATFGKAVSRSIAQHPEQNAEVKIGIIYGYNLSSTTQIEAQGRKVSISNQLKYSDETPSTEPIFMFVKGNGQFSFSNGSLSVVLSIFYVGNEPCTSQYIILMNYNSQSLDVKQCTFAVEVNDITIPHGFVEVRGGTVSIDQMTVKNMKMNGCSVIKLNNGTRQVNISRITFNNIQSTASNGGCAIFGELNDSSGIKLSELNFTQCVSLETVNQTNGGAVQLQLHGAILDMDKVVFTSCSGLNGGGMFIRLDQSSIMRMANLSKFLTCNDNSQSGGGAYFDVNEYSSCEIDNVEFTTCKAQQFGGGIYGTISGGGILTIRNTTTFTTCSCVGTNRYQEGGAINIVIKDGNSKFQVLSSTSFTSCSCKDLGGAININGSLGALIDIRQVTFTSCSSQGGGGLNAVLESGTIMNITNEVTFSLCSSTSLSNGGGIRAKITEPGTCLLISTNVKFDQCKTKGQGGGIYVQAVQTKIIDINGVTFDKCEATQGGGAISTVLTDGGTFYIEGSTNFTTCKTTGAAADDVDLGGGAVCAYVQGASSHFRVLDNAKFDKCESTFKGGAIFIQAEMSQLLEINSAIFQDCISNNEGGGIYSYITNGGSFILSNASKFTKCKSTSGSGGGLFTNVKTTTSEMQVTGGCEFDQCESGQQGGGVYISSDQSKINEVSGLVVTGCKAGTNGSGLFIEVLSAASFIISNQSSFKDCSSKGTAGSGGGIYAFVRDIDSKLVISDRITIDNCDSTVSGGGIFFMLQGRSTVQLMETLIQNCDSPKGGGICTQINSGSQLTILNSNQFKTCRATGTDGLGGGIYADVGDDGKLRCLQDTTFDTCTSTSGQGGGAYLLAKDRGAVDMNKITFTHCSSVSGGGAIYIDIQSSASFVVSNSSLFDNCLVTTGNGGGILAKIKDIDSKIVIQDDILFDTCKSTSGTGGAAYIELQSNATVEINKVTFSGCSAASGGAIQASLLTGSTFTITNESLFKTCSSTGSTSGGGGINANIDSFSEFIIQSSAQFDTCTSTNGKGGAGYFVIKDKGAVEVNQAIFKTCSSINGGALFADVESSSSFIVGEQAQFKSCTTTSGNGGAIYAKAKDVGSKIVVQSETQFDQCTAAGANGLGGAGYIEGSLNALIEINKAKVENCAGTSGGGIYCSVKTGSQLQVTNSSLFKGCTSTSSGGGLYLKADGTNSNVNISYFTVFDTCSSVSGQGGGSYLEVTNNASLELNKVTYRSCSSTNGGGMFGRIVNSTQFIVTSSNSYFSCSSSGRGGGMYLDFADNSTFNFLIGSLNLFKDNTASSVGRDIFINCNNFNFLDVSRRILFDVFSPIFEPTNAIFGTEYWTSADLIREPMVDYDLINRYITYFADTLYISNTVEEGNDEESCGGLGGACFSFTFAKTKVKTPEWRAQTAKYITKDTPKVSHEYVAVQSMLIQEQLTSEADLVTLRGLSKAEKPSAADYAKVYFAEIGQVVCSDLAKWQYGEDNEYSDIKGPEQLFSLHNLEFVLPEKLDVQSVLLVMGSSQSQKRGRNVEMRIEKCKVSQQSGIPSGGYCTLLKTQPYASGKSKISFADVQAYDIWLNNGSLIEIKYQPRIILKEDNLNFKDCQFNQIKSVISAWNISETPEEEPNQVPLGAGSVIIVRGSSSTYLPFHFYDCSFESCTMNMEVKITEKKLLGIGGAFGLFGMNVQIVLEHFRFIDCSGIITFQNQSLSSINSENDEEMNLIQNKHPLSEQGEFLFENKSSVSVSNEIKKPNFQIELSGGVYIGLSGENGEGRFKGKKQIAQFLKENGEQEQDLSPLIDSMHKPIIKLDSCLIKTCKSHLVNSGRGIRVIQSGGVIVHFDRIGANCDFRSSIFKSCLTTLSSLNPTSNLANSNSPYEPLWEREKRIGDDGSGLVVAHGVIKPYVRAKGVQFILCTGTLWNIYDNSKSPGQFNSEEVKTGGFDELEEQNRMEDQKIKVNNNIKQFSRPQIVKPSTEDISHLFLHSNSENKDNFVVHLKKGQFSTRTVLLQGTKLSIKGEGESLSSIMQKESSQHLFTLQDSQLNAFEMRAELWGASASLIQCIGLERSIISGLRVGGYKLGDGICNGAVFEVINGSLILIDIKVERVIMIQNENERNSDINDKNKMLGLIIIKENAKLLRLEKCLISNIHMEEGGSIIQSNGGLNSKLEIKDCNFIQESNAPWSGSAIRHVANLPGQVLDVDGAIFKGFTADSQYNSQGGAIYIDMTAFYVALLFRRCVFAQNSAFNGGANVFIAYQKGSLRIPQNSFLGCYACTYSSVDQEKSFQYTIGNDTELFIGERDHLHSSWMRQQNNDGVWFIGNEDSNHTYNPGLKCGTPTNPCQSFAAIQSYINQESNTKAETIQFCEGAFSSPLISVPIAQASSLNIVGYGRSITEISASSIGENVLIQGQIGQSVAVEKLNLKLSQSAPNSGVVNVQGSNAGLILSEVRVSGLSNTDSSSSTLEPKYLFHSAGIVYLEDVIIENIFLKTGSIILADQVRKSIEQSSTGTEWLGLRQSGIYGSYFNLITTNESRIISILDSSLQSNSKSTQNNIQELNALQSNADVKSFIVQDTIFSSCVTSVNLADTETKGGLIHILSNGVKVDIISSEFRRCQVLGRNMVYIGWNGDDSSVSAVKTMMISDTIFTGCSSAIPGMRVVAKNILGKTSYYVMYGSNENENENANEINSVDNELYADGKPTYDEIYKHGLVYLESLIKGDKNGVSSTQYDVYGVFSAGCHSAVGSGITSLKVTLQITESVFITPMCYSNIIYLNQTRGYIDSSFFKGRNSTYHDPALLTDSGDVVDDTWSLCPGKPEYYSSTTHGLVYVTNGQYEIDDGQFEQSQVGALKVDTANVILSQSSFVEPKVVEESLFDGGKYLIICVGKSRLEITDAVINGFSEENCSLGLNQNFEQWGLFENDASQCTFNILKDGECQVKVSSRWDIPAIPAVRLEKAQLFVNLTDEEEPLQFEIEGKNFIPLTFTVMIDILRLKTQKEIHDEVENNKEEKSKYRQVNTFFDLMQINQHTNFRKRNEESHKNETNQDNNPQPLLPYEITNEVDYPRDKHGRIIWPPEGATEVPFLVLGSVQGIRRAAFSMKDYSWLNARDFFYGVLASNDGKRFTGENGEEGKPIVLDVEVKYGEQFINLIEVFPSKTWLYLTIVGVILFVLLIVIIILIILFLRWAEIKKAILRRGQIQKVGNQDKEINEQIAEIEEEERKKQEAKKQKKLEKKLTQQKKHYELLTPYEEEQTTDRLIGANENQSMTEFVKEHPSMVGFERNSPGIQAYAQDLNSQLNNMEQQEGISPTGSQNSRKAKKEMIQYPKQEKGTLNQQITDFFAVQKPTTIDFSAMPANDPQLRGINWGASGIPATVGLGQQGYEKTPQQLLQLQKRQEQLLSKSATQYKVPHERKRSVVQQGMPSNLPSAKKSQSSTSTLTVPYNSPMQPTNMVSPSIKQNYPISPQKPNNGHSSTQGKPLSRQNSQGSQGSHHHQSLLRSNSKGSLSSHGSHGSNHHKPLSRQNSLGSQESHHHLPQSPNQQKLSGSNSHGQLPPRIPLSRSNSKGSLSSQGSHGNHHHISGQNSQGNHHHISGQNSQGNHHHLSRQNSLGSQSSQGSHHHSMSRQSSQGNIHHHRSQSHDMQRLSQSGSHGQLPPRAPSQPGRLSTDALLVSPPLPSQSSQGSLHNPLSRQNSQGSQGSQGIHHHQSLSRQNSQGSQASHHHHHISGQSTQGSQGSLHNPLSRQNSQGSQGSHHHHISGQNSQGILHHQRQYRSDKQGLSGSSFSGQQPSKSSSTPNQYPASGSNKV